MAAASIACSGHGLLSAGGSVWWPMASLSDAFLGLFTPSPPPRVSPSLTFRFGIVFVAGGSCSSPSPPPRCPSPAGTPAAGASVGASGSARAPGTGARAASASRAFLSAVHAFSIFLSKALPFKPSSSMMRSRLSAIHCCLGVFGFFGAIFACDFACACYWVSERIPLNAANHSSGRYRKLIESIVYAFHRKRTNAVRLCPLSLKRTDLEKRRMPDSGGHMFELRPLSVDLSRSCQATHASSYALVALRRRDRRRREKLDPSFSTDM